METVILYGDLDEEIYMKCPEGLKNASKSKQDNVLLFKHYIYCLVQGARQYHKKAVEILKKIGFIGGDVDLCLYMKKSKKEFVFICINQSECSWRLRLSSFILQ